MPTFKCPWCSTKSSFKSTITSHMKTCYRRPRKTQPVYGSYKTLSSVSSDDSLLDLQMIEAAIEVISDFSSSSDTSSSDSSFSGGGGDSGGGGASSDW